MPSWLSSGLASNTAQRALAPRGLARPGNQGTGKPISGSLKSLSPALWRTRLRQASFKGAPFHVEQQGRTSGRRVVNHEYPKRESNYCEDMGLLARRYSVVGYVIQRWPGKMIGNMMTNYDEARDLLITALENPEAGVLVDPYWNRIGPELYMCERYALTETRERGGYAQFEMSFIEAGEAAFGMLYTNTAQNIDLAAAIAQSDAASQLDAQQKVLNSQAGSQQLLF